MICPDCTADVTPADPGHYGNCEGNNMSEYAVQMHSEMGRKAHPAINIKVRAGADSVTLPIELGQVQEAVGQELKPVVTHPDFTHEWVEANLSESERNSWWEAACQDNYEVSKERAEDMLGLPVRVSQEGRSGGWLVVDGLPEVEDWDAELLERWKAYEKDVEAVVADVPRACLVQVYMNVFEPQREQDEPAPMTINIAPDDKSKAYYKGLAAGTKAADALPEGTEYESAIRFFWLSVGAAMTADGIDGQNAELVEAYIGGANTRQPDVPGVRVVATLEIPEGDTLDDEWLGESLRDVARQVEGGMRRGWLTSGGGTYDVSGMPF